MHSSSQISKGTLDPFDIKETLTYPHGFTQPDMLAVVSRWLTDRGYSVKMTDYGVRIKAKKKGLHVNFIPYVSVRFDRPGGVSNPRTVVTVHHWAKLRPILSVTAGVISQGITAAVGVGTYSIHVANARNLVLKIWDLISRNAAKGPSTLVSMTTTTMTTGEYGQQQQHQQYQQYQQATMMQQQQQQRQQFPPHIAVQEQHYQFRQRQQQQQQQPGAIPQYAPILDTQPPLLEQQQQQQLHQLVMSPLLPPPPPSPPQDFLSQLDSFLQPPVEHPAAAYAGSSSANVAGAYRQGASEEEAPGLLEAMQHKYRQEDYNPFAYSSAPQQFPTLDGGTQTMPSGAALASQVQAIRDLFPHLSEGYVYECLKYFNFNVEHTINNILENNLPPHLVSMDTMTPLMREREQEQEQTVAPLLPPPPPPLPPPPPPPSTSSATTTITTQQLQQPPTTSLAAATSSSSGAAQADNYPLYIKYGYAHSVPTPLVSLTQQQQQRRRQQQQQEQEEHKP
eukprot:GEZU01025367.1.p1 GENE.GEZU01025367.1~~GEZU01025367.1.p1  ORF type:complete len:507 (-),score=157.36 GEZU01025367.1:84-1604(-)